MPTVNHSDRMLQVYDRLKAEGLDPNYVRQVLLPDWWDDSLAETKSGFLHGLSFITQRAGIQIGPLMQQNQSVECRDFGQVKFKKPRNVGTSHIKWAKNIAASAAELVAEATCKPYRSLGSKPADLRKKIAQKTGVKTVTLPALLDLAWDHGIPVVFIGHLPPRYRRMDGMAARFNGRPAIVTSKKSAHDAWLSFIIAHELGHICCGHVKDGVVVDEAVDGADDDPEESEANAFAVELLTGSSSADYDLGTFVPTVAMSRAKRIGEEKSVDPGVVILNHAFHRAQKDQWGLVNKALNLLEPDANAPQLICSKLFGELDLKGLDDDQREYLERLVAPTNSAVSQ